mmetsp:Transcript_7020/g.18362  ORF Transcript_7020/g.18362 Transcript_7020/m.18362 type:complete len:210 (+) Transcript_7020:23-652(+)
MLAVHSLLDDMMASRVHRRVETFACDVSEDANGFTIVADLPGAATKDVSVKAKKGAVLIEARREEERWTLVHRERVVGSMSRAVALPETADLSRLKTTLRDGVLVVRVAKKGTGWLPTVDRFGRDVVSSVFSALPFVLYLVTVYAALAWAPFVFVQMAPIIDMVLSVILATFVFNLLFSLLLAPWSPPLAFPRVVYPIVPARRVVFPVW